MSWPSAAPETSTPAARGLLARQVTLSVWPSRAPTSGLANTRASFAAATARVTSVARCSGCSDGSGLRSTLSKSPERSREQHSSGRDRGLSRMVTTLTVRRRSACQSAFYHAPRSGIFAHLRASPRCSGALRRGARPPRSVPPGPGLTLRPFAFLYAHCAAELHCADVLVTNAPLTASFVEGRTAQG